MWNFTSSRSPSLLTSDMDNAAIYLQFSFNQFDCFYREGVKKLNKEKKRLKVAQKSALDLHKIDRVKKVGANGEP